MFNNNKKEDKLVNSTNGQSPSLNMISEGSTIDGSLITKNDVRVSGKVEGTVNSKSKLILSSTGFVNGNIEAADADIAGKVDGEVEVTNKLILRKSAVIEGDLYTNSLLVEEGATINGNIKMGQSKADASGKKSKLSGSPSSKDQAQKSDKS